jgi:hypothetical protein
MSLGFDREWKLDELLDATSQEKIGPALRALLVGDFALTGDTLFRHGVGRTDLPGGSEQKLWESIPRFLGLLPDATMLFSGHGPQWPAGEARRWWRMMS